MRQPTLLPDHWQELYEERAAIMEFDGKLSRQEAEEWAWREIQRLMRDRNNAPADAIR